MIVRGVFRGSYVIVLLSVFAPVAYAQDTRECFSAGSTVTGIVSDAPASHNGWVTIFSTFGCNAGLESTGTFRLSTVPGKQVIAGLGPDRCLMAVEADVPAGGTRTVRMQSVPLKSPLDDTVLLLPGAGYLPPTYDERQCRLLFEFVREHRGAASLIAAPRLADPDSIVALALRSPDVSPWLGRESPIQFRYWNEPRASEAGVVAGKSYEIRPASQFMIVEALTTSSVDLRVGSSHPWPGQSELWRMDLNTGRAELVERFDGYEQHR